MAFWAEPMGLLSCRIVQGRPRQTATGLYLLDDLLGHRLLLTDRTKAEQKITIPSTTNMLLFKLCFLPTAQAERKQGEVCACPLEGQRPPHRFGDYVAS